MEASESDPSKDRGVTSWGMFPEGDHQGVGLSHAAGRPGAAMDDADQPPAAL